MADRISAFAVYKKGSTKKSDANKKKSASANHKGATPKKSKKEEHAAVPATSGAIRKVVTVEKDKSKERRKSNPQNSKRQENGKPKSPAKSKGGATNSTTKVSPHQKNSGAGTSGTKPTTKKQNTAKHTVVNGKNADVPNGVENNDGEMEEMLDQLLASSPNNKKYTMKQRRQLDEYLMEKLSEHGVHISTDEDQYFTSDSEEFSEFTLNSDTSESEEESDSEEEESAVGENQANSKEESMPEASTSRKRQINGTSAIENDNVSAPKNSRQQSTTERRKTLPTASSANGSKAQKRRSLNDASGQAPKPLVKIVDAKVKLEPLSPPSNVVKINSINEGEKVFTWLLSPLDVKEFYSKYWEQGACLIRRRKNMYYSRLISFKAIDQMLLENHVEFTKNIDITSYKNGVRETLNPVGRAMPPAVWDYYGQGCSIRLLNPQTFLPHLYTVSATMQEYFHCLVGANAYLTPPNSQGFAPHYDDIEAFVLQIEGRKRWRLYKPRSASEHLPRVSSKNFAQDEIGEPIFDEVLEPGDVLYFPRGTIHQATTEPGHHSLHITLSVYQKQSFADLLEKMMPMMLERAIASNIELRRGLPLHVWQNAGIAFNDSDTKERADFEKHIKKLMSQCLQNIPFTGVMDAAVDQLAKRYQHEALPPEILPSERVRTVFGSHSTTDENGDCICDYQIDERTNVRLLRAHIIRLVKEDDKYRIFYYLDNSKEYCEYEPNFIEIEAEEAASVEVLIRSYPEYIGVSQLPLADEESKVQLVTALWERGLLMLEKPFR